jgi:hypothetical protein
VVIDHRIIQDTIGTIDFSLAAAALAAWVSLPVASNANAAAPHRTTRFRRIDMREQEADRQPESSAIKSCSRTRLT